MAKGKGKKVPRSADLNITSMMDMFTIILVFLLKSFSADGSILTNADNLVLPNSESKKKPQEVNLQVAVTNDMIWLITSRLSLQRMYGRFRLMNLIQLQKNLKRNFVPAMRLKSRWLNLVL